MKKSLLPFLMLFILIFYACQEKIDVEKEKQAIITVLNEESQAYLDRDYERLASCWLQDESVRRISASPTGYSFTTWEEMSNNMKEGLANDSNWVDTENLKYEKSDFNIKIFPDCAWVTCTQKFTGKYQGEPIDQESIHLNVMEKVEGQWKIAAFVEVGKSAYEEAETEETAEE
jgi:hypothetical protein